MVLLLSALLLSAGCFSDGGEVRPEEGSGGQEGGGDGGPDGGGSGGAKTPEPVDIREGGGQEVGFSESFEWDVQPNWTRIYVTFVVEVPEGRENVLVEGGLTVTADGAEVCSHYENFRIIVGPTRLLLLDVAAEDGEADRQSIACAGAVAPGTWRFTGEYEAIGGDWSFVATVEY